VKNAPGEEEVENFWREIYGEKVSHNGEACWLKELQKTAILGTPHILRKVLT
jgi:hypothetical protein